MSRFQVPANAGEERRKEKVELTWGDIWVWGMTAAEALRTIEREWRYARVWLHKRLADVAE